MKMREEKAACKSIKETLEKRYGPSWQIIIGITDY